MKGFENHQVMGKRFEDCVAMLTSRWIVDQCRALVGKEQMSGPWMSGAEVIFKMRESAWNRWLTVRYPVRQVYGAEREAFVADVARRPELVEAVRRWELSDELVALARQHGMVLFPEQWDELGLRCSCGGGRTRCVHSVMLLVGMAIEVERNPLVLFNIRGFDLMLELEQRGLDMDGAYKRSRIPVFHKPMEWTGLRPVTEKVKTQVNLSGLKPPEPKMIDRLSMRMAALGQDDMRDRFDKLLWRTQHKLTNIFSGRSNMVRVLRGANPMFHITPHTPMPVVVGQTPWETYMLALIRGERNREMLMKNPEAWAHYEVLRIAIHMFQNRWVAPRLSGNGSDHFWVSWMPLMYEPVVQRIMQELQQMIPENLVRFPTKGTQQCYATDQAFWMVCGYLDTIVQRFAPKCNDDDILNMIFHGEVRHYCFEPIQIQTEFVRQWLDNLWMTADRYQPRLLIGHNEEEGLFEVTLGYTDALQSPAETQVISCAGPQLQDDRRPGAQQALHLFSALAYRVPVVRQALEQQPCGPVKLSIDDFIPFLTESVPLLDHLRVPLALSKDLRDLIRPKRTMRIEAGERMPGAIGIDDLLSFRWQVALGDQVVDYDEFVEMVHNKQTLLHLNNQYILVTPADLNRLKQTMEEEPVSVGRLLQAALLDEYESAPITLTDEARRLIGELTRQPEIPLPTGLQATLRPYQERGYSWLYRNMRLGLGSILADDMGLGKTLQTIALLLKLKEEGRLSEKKALVVVPTSLIPNWQNEIERFAPSLSVQVYHGGARSLKGFQADILLTTYGVARGDVAQLRRQPWRVMVIDEAQNIKNHTVQQSRAIRTIPADTHIALSGTPVENRLSEFWSIMDYCNHGFLGPIADFNARYARPIQQEQDEECTARFRRITAPFMMRRLKSDKDIISDLPDKIEKNEYATLRPEQAALYQSTLNEAMATIEAINPDDPNLLFRRKGLILQMILALKQVCNHPAQYLKNDDQRPELSGKAELLLQLAESILEAGDKALIFTQFTAMGEMLCRFLAERTGQQPLFLHGGLPISERARLVEQFQNDPSRRLFVLSLKAAGTGLNLTAASHVIHYDLWWNPAVESQATDRAYRIGQQRNVMVHRLITQGTFEERIDRMIQDKRHLADVTVSSGEGWIANLSNDELREIFG